MTREEKLTTMRSKDLVQYCLDNGIKVYQTRGMLKESRAAVVSRILATESGEPEPEWKADVDNMLAAFKKEVTDHPNAEFDETWIDKIFSITPLDAFLYFMQNLK